MKTLIYFVAVCVLLAACGPSRMSCYGKRCVSAENPVKKASGEA
ncbi:MAG TPA: hypothetical protein PLA69_04040 [Flavobacterium sp.]|nr:hypothetical protein [Flavobacterium sp.]